MKTKTKTPTDHATRWLGKQKEQFEGASLPEEQKQQLVDWAEGLFLAAQGLAEVVDPSNPPAPGTVQHALIEHGRKARMQRLMLSGLLGSAGTPAQAPQAPAPQAPQAPAPQVPAAASPVAPTAASVGV